MNQGLETAARPLAQNYGRARTTRQGLPAANTSSGMSRVTTLPAAIHPDRMPGMTR